MATQKFEDGSLDTVNNAKTSGEIKERNALIQEALHRLTHPDKIIEMTKQMEEQGLLTEEDVERLKGKDKRVITLEQTHDMQSQKQQEEIDREEEDEIR